MSDAHDRVALVAAAVTDAPGLVCDAREVGRPGPTYTADTLAELRAEDPDAEYFFVLGEDAAAALPAWDR
ncbi:MAG: nicotinate-nicotinamide nucleotide adenylyltransferase, partial [Candidatus Nanopelagicales bacterium]